MSNLMNDPSIHYVKFMRGSAAAWQTLQNTPERINDDTLYFIYENATTSTDGKLYLGKKLISGAGNGGSLSGIINIADIGDVYINTEALADKQILVYNSTTQEWENTPLSTIISTAVGVMQGATASVAGTSGLVPVPKAGDQGKFLRGDGSWTTINIPTFNTDIFSLDSNNDYILNGYHLAPTGSVLIKTDNGVEWSDSVIGSLNYQISTKEKLLAQIAGTDPEPIDTQKIYLVDNGNDVSTGNKYDEYIIINNKLEQIGTLGSANLTEYVKVTTFNTAISQLEDVLYDKVDESTGENEKGLISRVSYLEQNIVSKADIGDLGQLILSEGNSTLVDEVNTMNNNITSIAERLRWQELEEETK